MIVHELFATPVSVQFLDKNKFETYHNILNKMFDDKTELYFAENGWKTTKDDLHHKKEFQGLINIIDENAKIYAEEVLGIDFKDFKMTSMWSNAHEKLSLHPYHQHPNSFFSGVLYLNIPECEFPGKLVFTDPRPAKNMFFADYKKQTHISERNFWFEPVTGQLIFFPSWLEHGTRTFSTSTDEKRISLSFNYNLVKCTYNTMHI